MPDLEALWRDALALKPDDWALTLGQTAADSVVCSLHKPDLDGHAVLVAHYRASAPQEALSAMVRALRRRSSAMPL